MPSIPFAVSPNHTSKAPTKLLPFRRGQGAEIQGPPNDASHPTLLPLKLQAFDLQPELSTNPSSWDPAAIRSLYVAEIQGTLQSLPTTKLPR